MAAAWYRPRKRRARKPKSTKTRNGKRSPKGLSPTKRERAKEKNYLAKLRAQALAEIKEAKKRANKWERERDTSTGRFAKGKPRPLGQKKARETLNNERIPKPQRSAVYKRPDARKGTIKRYSWRFKGQEGIDLALDLLKEIARYQLEEEDINLKARIVFEAEKGVMGFATKYKGPLKIRSEFRQLIEKYEERMEEMDEDTFDVFVYVITYRNLKF